MDNVLHKMPAENESQYIWRVGQAKDSGLIDSTWEELTPILNAQCGISEEDFRGSSAWRKRYRVMQQAWDDVFSQQKFTNEHTETIQEHTRELEKAKIKLQTEKLEYNRWLREEARDELICERICNAIRDLAPLEVPQVLYSNDNISNNKDAALVISDQHYGAEFTIKGLFGETLNEYSPEIFEARMWDLLNQVIEICLKEGFDSLNATSELLLTVLAASAQEESKTKSNSMNWSLEKRFDNHNFLTPVLLGYDHDEDGNLTVNPTEANTVKLMFYSFLAGFSLTQVAELLNELGRPSKKGNVN
jgi:hypothetical protein